MFSAVDWGALANVVLVGVVVGAGLPGLYALGVKALAGPGARRASGRVAPLRIAVAVGCFAVVVAAVAVAIGLLASGSH